MTMIPYDLMYARLCGAASDALDALEAGQPLRAQVLLRRALAETEELYIQRAGED